jgi:hypothetical protein
MYERGLAQLATMIAYYDHDMARMLLLRLAVRVCELAAQESSAPWLTLPVLAGPASW